MVGKRPFLVVTGMHRSGTSFLVRALNLSGLYLGPLESLSSHDLRGSFDNERGNWENKKIIELAEKLLTTNKGSWDNPPKKIVVNKKLKKELKKNITELINNQDLIVGFKDPRAILYLDSIAKELPKNIILVGIFRNPLKVAESLKNRNGFDYNKSLALWKSYNEKLLELLAKHKGFLLDFDWPQKKLFAQLKLINKKLGLNENVDLSNWHTKSLLKSDKTFRSKYKIPIDVKKIYSKLKAKSNKNSSVKIKKVSRTAKDLQNIIENLLIENQQQFSYFRDLNKESSKFLESAKKETAPLTTLMKIYSTRPDLQKEIPEVVKGDYSNLILWAANICKDNKSGDFEIRKKISKYLPWYEKYLKLSNAQKEAQGLAKQVAEFQNQINHLTSENDLKMRKMEELTSENAERKRMTEELTAEKVDSTKKIGEMTSENVQSVKKIGEITSEYELTKREVEELASQKVLNEKKIEELNSENTQREKKIEELNSENTHREKKIEELNSENVHRKKHIEELTSEQAKSTKKIAELNSEKEQREDQINELRLENEENEKELKSTNKILDEKIKDNLVLRTQNQQVAAETHALMNEIENIRTSHMFKTMRKVALSLEKIKGIKSQIKKTEYPTLEENYNFNDTTNYKYYQELQKSFQYSPTISVIMEVDNPKISNLEEAIKSLKLQYYDNWQLFICVNGSQENSVREILDNESEEDRVHIIYQDSKSETASVYNKILPFAKEEFVLLLNQNDALTKNALIEVVKLLNRNKDLDYIYSDEDKINQDGEHVEPFFKPDWSPDLLLSTNYARNCSVFRKSSMEKVGPFRENIGKFMDYEFILRFTEKTDKIAHIPAVLYHSRMENSSNSKGLKKNNKESNTGIKIINEALKRRGLDAECLSGNLPGTFRVKYSIKENPLVSILIPTINLKNLEKCVKSILEKSTYQNFEIIVIDGSKSEIISKFTDQYQKVTRHPSPILTFNFSKINNFAVSKSNGEYVVFLNDDTEIIEPSWLEELLGPLQRKDVGIVGAKLLYPDDRVQHGGTVIGMQGFAGNYGGMYKDDPHYFGMHMMIRNVSAVTAACMCMKKELFDSIGGYDEELANSWQDVDLCLHVRKLGKQIVYNPFSLIYHYEGATRGKRDYSKNELEARMLFKRNNIEEIEKGDPFYNQNLSHSELYVLDPTPITSSNPMDMLIKIYKSRSDLQKSFPEVEQEDYQGLINWAATYGVTADFSRYKLIQFNEYYVKRASNEIKDLAEKIWEFNSNPIKLKEFPEIMEGDFSRIKN